MSLLRVVFLAPTLLFAAGALSPASAFSAGGWEGKASRDDSGKFSDCTMTADYKNGVMLAFIISRDFDWGLVLVKDDWTLKPGDTEPVSLEIDDREAIQSTGKIIDPKGILVPLENADPVVSALRNGTQLTVAMPAGTFSFELGGTRDAIAALAGCVADNLQQEAAQNGVTVAARETKSTSPDNSHRLFSGQEAATFTSSLLSAAGVANYQLVAPDKNPMPNFDVVWTYPNGMIGALAAFKDMESVDVGEAANVVMADDTKNCQGDFSSGKKIATDEGGVHVKRVYTVCRSGGSTVEIHYTLFKTESGHLYQLAHLNLGDATGDIANADSVFLKPAAVAEIK